MAADDIKVVGRQLDEAPLGTASSDRSQSLRAHWPTVLCLSFVALGVLLRARQFTARRSLWLDEAMITDNILRRNLHQLTQPLSHHQGAPFGWLVSEKIAVHVFGANEYSLRLIAFLTGSLTLVLLWWVGVRVLPRRLVPLVVIAGAISPQLIRYSNEAKQYSSDSFAVMLVVALAIWLVTCSRIGWRHALAWAVGCSLAVFLSHPGILATASCGAVVFAWLIGLRAWRACAWIAGASCVVGAALLAHYELALKNLSHDAALKYYWRDGNPPKPLHVGTTLRWLGRALLAYTHDPLKLAPPLLVGLLLIAGLIALVRRGWVIAAVLIAPLVAQLIASTAGIFPLSGRLVLGYVPVLLLILASAPALFTERRWLGVGIAVAVIAVLSPNASLAARQLVHPAHFEELRPVLQQVKKDRHPDDLVFIHYPSGAAVSVYGLMGIDVPSNGSMFTARGRVCTDGSMLQRARALGQRVWFVSGHQQSYFLREGQLVRAHLSRVGRVLEDVRRPGSEALLVQLPPTLPTHQPSIAGTCLALVRVR